MVYIYGIYIYLFLGSSGHQSSVISHQSSVILYDIQADSAGTIFYPQTQKADATNIATTRASAVT